MTFQKTVIGLIRRRQMVTAMQDKGKAEGGGGGYLSSVIDEHSYYQPHQQGYTAKEDDGQPTNVSSQGLSPSSSSNGMS